MRLQKEARQCIGVTRPSVSNSWTGVSTHGMAWRAPPNSPHISWGTLDLGGHSTAAVHTMVDRQHGRNRLCGVALYCGGPCDHDNFTCHRLGRVWQWLAVLFDEFSQCDAGNDFDRRCVHDLQRICERQRARHLGVRRSNATCSTLWHRAPSIAAMDCRTGIGLHHCKAPRPGRCSKEARRQAPTTVRNSACRSCREEALPAQEWKDRVHIASQA